MCIDNKNEMECSAVRMLLFPFLAIGSGDNKNVINIKKNPQLEKRKESKKKNFSIPTFTTEHNHDFQNMKKFFFLILLF